MQKTNRPLSPHLTIYKAQITSLLSILHRFTGILLVAIMLFFTWWLIFCIFSGWADCYTQILELKIVKLAFYFISLGFFFHMFNGIRHLLWDFGVGLDILSVIYSGWFVMIMTVVSASAIWLMYIKI